MGGMVKLSCRVIAKAYSMSFIFAVLLFWIVFTSNSYGEGTVNSVLSIHDCPGPGCPAKDIQDIHNCGISTTCIGIQSNSYPDSVDDSSNDFRGRCCSPDPDPDPDPDISSSPNQIP